MTSRGKKEGSHSKWNRSSSLLLWPAAIGLIVAIFLPWWGMQFLAPQYPEGLNVVVYPYKMEGQLDALNSLNHYIGMKEINVAAFPEINYLPYIIAAFAVLIMIGSILKSRMYLNILTGVLLIGGIIGIYDISRR
ncbi:MAG TPA: hypothetical protein VJ824_02050, partial [Bacillota bacterium]|nr:hypothetical protein [Bacillota bacterium]